MTQAECIVQHCSRARTRMHHLSSLCFTSVTHLCRSSEVSTKAGCAVAEAWFIFLKTCVFTALENTLKVKEARLQLKVQLVDCQIKTFHSSLNQIKQWWGHDCRLNGCDLGMCQLYEFNYSTSGKHSQLFPFFPHIVTALLHNRLNSLFPSQFYTHHPIIKTFFLSKVLQMY